MILRSLIILLLALPALAPHPAMQARAVKGQPAAGGGSGISITDNFDRTDSEAPGANWTEAAGDADIVSNVLEVGTANSWDVHAIIYSGTACTSVDQYIKVTYNSGVDKFPSVILRYTDASNPFYVVYADHVNGRISWARAATAAGLPSIFSNTATTVGATDTWGFTVSGTGTSTVLRGWRNPTAAAPTSMSSWDGGAATITVTDDPPTAVNTGNFIGLAGEQNNPAGLDYNNFSGGNL